MSLDLERSSLLSAELFDPGLTEFYLGREFCLFADPCRDPYREPALEPPPAAAPFELKFY